MNDTVYALHGFIQGYYIQYITLHPFYLVQDVLANEKGLFGGTPEGSYPKAFFNEVFDDISTEEACAACN
jgi:hypothetical protein